MGALAARLSRWVTRLEGACLAGGVLGIAGLTIANVLSRVALDESLASAEELSQILVVLVTFVGVGHAAARGRHIRMTALYDQLGAPARKRLATTIAASTSALLFLLAFLGLRYALGTVRELGSVTPVLELPRWVIVLAAPLGLGLGGIQYALAVVKNLTTPADQVWLSFQVRDDDPPEDEAPGDHDEPARDGEVD